MSREPVAIRWRSLETTTDAEPRPLALDVELERLHAELNAAGVRARLAGRGGAQPTRFFAQHLRTQLVRSALERRAKG